MQSQPEDPAATLANAVADTSVYSRKITLPLPYFLEILFGYKEKAPVKLPLGLIISKLDPLEELCHVELPTPENSLSHPIVHEIREWRTSNQKYLRDKELAELRRQAWTRKTEALTALTCAIKGFFSVSDSEALCMAEKIIDRRSSVAAANFGVNITFNKDGDIV